MQATSVTERPQTSGAGTADSTDPRAANGRRRPVFRILLPILLIIAVALGVWYFLHWRGIETTDDAFIEGHIVAISSRVAGHVLKVHVTDNQAVKAGDVLVELDARDLESRLAQAKAALEAARARGKSAQSGTEVTQTTTGAGVEQALAGVKMAEAAIQTASAGADAVTARKAEAEAQVTAADAAAEQASADVRASEAEVARTEADLRRFEELIESKSVSQQQLDYARSAAKSAAAKLEANRKKVAAADAMVVQARAGVQVAALNVKQAESLLNEARSRFAEAQARLSSAKSAPQQVQVSAMNAQSAAADMEAAQAALRQAELNLSYARIVAPCDGRVTRRLVEAGAYFQVGQPMLLVVEPRVWVVANFKETQLRRMKPGQTVDIHVDAYPHLDLRGRIDSIQAGTGSRFSLLPPENATGNYVKVVQRVPVKIVIDDLPQDSPLLAPGMSVIPKVRVQ